MPLGILYALVAAKKANVGEVRFIDLSTVNPSYQLPDALEEFSPNIVGIGIHSAVVFPTACELAETIKRHNSNVTVVAGGLFPSSQPQICLAGRKFDYVLQGEVDESLMIFLRNVRNGKHLNTPGLIARMRGKTDVTYLPLPSFTDLNQLPRVPEKGFDIKPYLLIDPLVSHSGRTLNVSSARGCPHNCAYCCYKVIGGGRRRYRSAKLLAEDLGSFRSEYGISQFNFVDDDFLFSMERVVQFCRIVSGHEFAWRCQSRTDSFAPETFSNMVDFLYDAGCRMISFGIESGDPDLLKKMNKPIDIQWAKHVLLKLKEGGIGTRIYVMIGLPYQTVESIEKTKQFLREVKPTSVSVELFVPRIGSTIGNNPEAWGIIWETHNIEDKMNRIEWYMNPRDEKVRSCIRTRWLSSEQIEKMRDEIEEEWC